MNQLAYTWEAGESLGTEMPADSQWVDPAKRSIWQPVLLIFPVLVAGGGYIASAPFLTDLAFCVLAVLCVIFLMGDLFCFSERFGLGGVVLYAGVLIWFCDDYFAHWFMAWTPHWDQPIGPEVVAKSAFYHVLYVLCLSIGLRFRIGHWLSKFITSLPEASKPSDYFWIVIFTQLIGIAPYFIFTREPFYLAIYHQFTAGRGGIGPEWTVGRTGNVNYSWGGYVAQILQVGTGGAVLAAFCVVFLRQNIWKNIVRACIWLFWLAMAFGDGTRGEVVLVMMPLVCFVFIRFHVQAQEFLHRFSVRAYVIAAIIVVIAFVIVQIQIRFRGVGFSDIDLSQISLHAEGNAMFSEGLLGFEQIPDRHDYFYDTIPGEAILLPIPNVLFWAAVAPMPRAVWQSKPIDPSWEWYNAISTGRATGGGAGIEGTTIAQGIVGYWFFRFGLPGVIEGGLFMGWILSCTERALLNNRGRVMAVLFALGILDWFFRGFRDIGLPALSELMVVLAGIELGILILRPFSRREPSQVEYSDA